MARTMLCENNVAKQFWAEAVNIACYIVNSCLIGPILKKTPYELQKGRKPNVSYFHAFGCICYIHNNGINVLGKFDAKSDEGMFLGYCLTSKAYRVYIKRTRLVEESMHLVFHESNRVPLSKVAFEENQDLQEPNLPDQNQASNNILDSNQNTEAD
ncbi:hypothetical protein L6164_005689 [Bauhinia variegata]|uniref:Uncharacterized protein n=1 Tax=Bauhinia variegata TaxID=167791 RepID=A0ACB9PSK3_BAUVA|nr:hypothetical protein L6164_005689 [Bauhinia variegata]